MTQIPAGWYPDPAPQTAPGRLRYWDGEQWTVHLHDPRPVAPPPPYPSSAPALGTPAADPYRSPAITTTPDGVPLAGWWWRVLARTLDGFIALPLLALAVTPVVASQWDELQRWFDDLSYAVDHHTPDPPTPDLFNFTTGPGFTLVLSGLAAYFLYEAVFLFWKQATPGKLIVGLRVRRREDPALPGSSILRRLGFLLLGQFCGLLLLLDYLWPLWDPKKQALHDKVAGTNVVRDRQVRPAVAEPPDPAASAGLPPRW